LQVIARLNGLKSRWHVQAGNFGGPFLGRDHLQCGGQPVCKLFDEKEMYFNPSLECDLGIRYEKISFEKSWIFKHNNATVISSPGGLHGISQNSCLIPGLCLLNEDYFFKTRLLIPKPKQIIEKAFILESSHSSNYYHWCVEVLPVLGLMPKLDGMKAITLRRNAKRELQIQDAVRGLFDIHFHDGPVLVKELYAVSGLFPVYGAFRPEPVLNFWKTTGKNGENTKRIYLTRGNALRRRLLNEKDILKILKPLGFETVDCDVLNLADQEKYFESAETIVGIHGAGLTNLIHCQKGANVIEVFGPGFKHFFYRYLSEIFGLGYQAVQAAPVLYKNPSEAHCADFNFDNVASEKLKEALTNLGIQ